MQEYALAAAARRKYDAPEGQARALLVAAGWDIESLLPDRLDDWRFFHRLCIVSWIA